MTTKILIQLKTLLFILFFCSKVVMSQECFDCPDTPYLENHSPSILQSKYHLIQLFGDASLRSSNFFESNYNGGVYSGNIRIIFPRFSTFINSEVPLPDPFVSGVLSSLKDINWENRFDYGFGIEWRPFSKLEILELPLLRWIKQLRFYSIFLNTQYLQYQTSWSWMPKTDFRYGLEYYKESHLYDMTFFWSEVWADASWRKTDFYVNDYQSWTFATVPKFGFKIFSEDKFCIMPYVTGEIAFTERCEYWQNRALAGIGIRIMPFRWNETRLNIFAKGLRLYIEKLWVVSYYYYYKDRLNIPNNDLRAGLNYTINWW
jgi:hypothetical protein